MALSDKRLAIKAALEGQTAGGYTLSADRVTLGYVPLDPSVEFFRDISTDGPYAALRPGGRENTDFQTGLITVSLTIDVWLGISQVDNNTFINEEDFIDELCSALHANQCEAIAYSTPDILTIHSPTIVHYAISCRATTC